MWNSANFLFLANGVSSLLDIPAFLYFTLDQKMSDTKKSKSVIDQ